MRISELLKSMAADLERTDNEAFLLAEYDEACLERVVAACVLAAEELRKAAQDVDQMEPIEEPKLIDAEGIESVANLATALDETGDPALQKQASVLDQLLLTVCANKDDLKAKKARDDARFEAIQKNYHDTTKELEELNKVSDVKKAIEDSGLTEDPKILKSDLSTRHCPDHFGTQVQRIADSIVQCPIDGKQYDFSAGFTLENGVKVPGSSVSDQTIQGTPEVPAFSEFDDRVGRLNRNS